MYEVNIKGSEGGIIEPSGVFEYEDGEYATFDMIAEDGYDLLYLYVNGEKYKVPIIDKEQRYYQFTTIVKEPLDIFAQFGKSELPLFIKRDKSWARVKKVFKKENGTWIEREPIEIFKENMKLHKIE